MLAATASPTSLRQFEDRSRRNSVMLGVGPDMEIHLPCPFCGAADFLVYRLSNIKAPTGGAVCRECERGSRVTYHETDGARLFEAVQTCGPAQPDWMEPKMRRLT